jgi:hypothetical protein
MSLNHARVKAADLRLHLFERSVHPELFQILRCIDLIQRGWRASLVISGQSHVLSVRAGTETLTEIVSPAGVSLPRIGLKQAVQLGREASAEVRREGGLIQYAASVRAQTIPPAEYAQAIARILAEDTQDRIKAFFDDESRPGAADHALPFALMDFRHGPRRLDVTSVHACPRELTIVRIETRMQFDEVL